MLSKPGTLAKGGQPYQKKPTGDIVLLVEPTLTLKELKIEKRESVESQVLASIPEKEFEDVAKGTKTKAAAIKELRAAELAAQRATLAASAATIPHSDRWQVHHADMAT